MDKESADKLRGMVRRVTLKNLRDDGETQRASVEVGEGIWHDDVEIMQAYGFASSVPEDGALGIVLAVGGDQGDLIVLPVGNPSKRMGGLNPGEAGVFNEHGDGVLVGADGGITVKAGGSITLKVGGVTLTLTGGGVAIEGGTVTHNGKDIGDTHKHEDVTPGAALTGVPA